MNEITLYWLPNCDTCQKAKKFLDAKGVEISLLHNLKQDNLKRKEIENLAQMIGGVDLMFSRRAIKYREMGLNKREVSETEMLDLITSDYTFVKRPVLVRNGKAIAGFSEKSFESFLLE